MIYSYEENLPWLNVFQQIEDDVSKVVGMEEIEGGESDVVSAREPGHLQADGAIFTLPGKRLFLSFKHHPIAENHNKNK